jgi:copper(I)-binding protein
MKQLVAVAAVALCGLCLSLEPVVAEPATSTITVTKPWIRATPRGAKVAGGYATITNMGKEPDRLVSASIPTAPEGQIHSMTMDNGVMHMARLDDGLAIAPGATVTLAPGGFHVMFVNPRTQLKEGEIVQGTLTFAKAGAIPVTFAVAGMAAKTASDIKTAPGAKAGHAAMKMDGMDMSGHDMGGHDMGGHDMGKMDMK